MATQQRGIIPEKIAITSEKQVETESSNDDGFSAVGMIGHIRFVPVAKNPAASVDAERSRSTLGLSLEQTEPG